MRLRIKDRIRTEIIMIVNNLIDNEQESRKNWPFYPKGIKKLVKFCVFFLHFVLYFIFTVIFLTHSIHIFTFRHAEFP